MWIKEDPAVRAGDTRTSAVDVWVVDDSDDERLLLEAAASEARHAPNFRFVGDGNDLVSAIDGWDDALPDLIVLDVAMPGLDGHETLAILKADDRWRQVPVVMFTTSPRPADRERAFELGAADFVIKSTAFSELVQFVDSLAERVGDSVSS